MGILGRIANDIRIDSSNELNDLKNRVNNRRFTGGICRYTVNHYDKKGLDLRSSNLSNNFDNGKKKRVEYNDINSEYFYKLKDRKLVNTNFGMTDSIGGLYKLPDDVSNSKLKFTTENDFTLLNKELRDLNIRYNNNFTVSRSEDYASNYILGAKKYNGGRVPNSEVIGEEYTVGNIPFRFGIRGDLMVYSVDFKDKMMSKTKDVSKKISNNNQSVYNDSVVKSTDETTGMQYSLTNNYDDISTTHLDRFYSKSYNYFLPENISKKKLEYYTELRKYNSNFSYFKSDKPGQAIDKNLNIRDYGDVIKLPNIEEIAKDTSTYININGDSLFVKGYEYLESILERDKDIFGYFEDPYGIDDVQEYYSINETRDNKSHISITKDRDGELIRFKDNGNKKTYIAYSEAENEEDSVPVAKTDGNDVITSFNGNNSLLLEKTNELFKKMKINSMINRFHLSKINGDEESPIDGSDELMSSYTDLYGISRGRNLITKKAEKSLDKKNGYENPYCRVWTMAHQYSKLSRRIRPFYDGNKSIGIEDTVTDANLRPNREGRLNKYSVLGTDGFVKITPRNEGGVYEEGNSTIRKYMFSIENLAWKDVDMESAGISKEQIGPNGGRIMWFPPYNLKFNENVSVEWNSNKFIGRGEQIYTYTNTERSGTLDFTLLIDHPSIINKLNSSGDKSSERERDLLRFFAGCNNLEFDDDNKKPTVKKEPIFEPPIIIPKMEPQSKDIAYVLFFPNNYSGVDYTGEQLIEYVNNGNPEYSLRNYECDKNQSNTFTLVDKSYSNQVYNATHNNINKNVYSMNNENSSISGEVQSILFNKGDLSNESLEVYYIFDTQHGINKLSEFILSCGTFGDNLKNVEITSIDLYGFASSHGKESFNHELGKRRANTLRKIIETSNLGSTIDNKFNENITTDIITVSSPRNINDKDAKIARSAVAVFHVQWDMETETSSVGDNINKTYKEVVDAVAKGSKEEKVKSTTTEENNQSVYKYDNEYLYFSTVMEDEIAYQSILSKVRYFLPAYHSITPEGFNARLSFLHQCTRQGPTVDLSSGRVDSNSDNYLKFAGNLSFGRPPYCILRIGDFFHTKICIDSISISYDTDGGIQWDLNPEGAGVQPMFANVTIGFKFIGGQDISGPIERLQNAVTYNYYANASVYDEKADYRNGDGQLSKPYDVMFKK